MLIPTGLSKAERKAYVEDNSYLLSEAPPNRPFNKHPGLRKSIGQRLADLSDKIGLLEANFTSKGEALAESNLTVEAIASDLKEAIKSKDKDAEEQLGLTLSAAQSVSKNLDAEMSVISEAGDELDKEAGVLIKAKTKAEKAAKKRGERHVVK